MSKRPHHKMGCLKCGARRKSTDVLEMKHDVMFYDAVNNTIFRAGMCPTCFEADTYNYDTIQQEWYASEKLCYEERKRAAPPDTLERFKTARFTNHMKRGEYWAVFRDRFPGGPRSPDDFLVVIRPEGGE